MSLFRHTALVIVLFILAGLGRPAYAQLPTPTIETLAVDLWPDYDRTAVLVLLTGTLPATALLPTTVTIPLPPEAELHAVARITSDNVMTDDVQYTASENGVTFVTSDQRFRVEYYMPYTTAGSQHSFEFSWLADVAVNEIDVVVQQPAAASNMRTQPTAISSSANSRDGLTYHVLPVTAVPAGQPYSVQVDYTMNQPTLSVEQLAPSATNTNTSSAVTPATGDGLNWPLLLAAAGGILILMAIVWQAASMRQQRKRPRKTPPQRTPPAPKPAVKAVQFCHECGAPVGPEDKFCRECGTAVKSRF